MSRFKDILRGSLSRKSVTFPLLWGGEQTCAVVPLTGAADADILRGAREFAIARGITDPKDGDPLYELGMWCHTLLRAAVDPESPENAPVPFFGSVEEILDGLDRDRIALLFEAQQRWQDHCAPRPKSMTVTEFAQAVFDHAMAPEDIDELPFERWPRVTQRSFVRTLASQHVILHAGRSEPGPASAQGSEKSSTNSSSSVAEPSEVS